MTSFGARLHVAFATCGQLCVGIDPHDALLRSWGLESSAAGVREFGLRVVDASAGRVAAVKPQVAFFERFGSAGFAALEEILAAARAADLLSIADAKRGDIGSTMDGYAQAWLTPGAPLEADALTVSPYLGPDSLRATIAYAVRHDKGLFVLSATSNPEARGLQSAELTVGDAGEGQSVADWVAASVGWANRSQAIEGDLGPVGLVVGATVDRSDVGLADETLHRAPILAPGFGAQGAQLSELHQIFGPLSGQVLASASRSILAAGPHGLVEAINHHNRDMQESS